MSTKLGFRIQNGLIILHAVLVRLYGHSTLAFNFVSTWPGVSVPHEDLYQIHDKDCRIHIYGQQHFE